MGSKLADPAEIEGGFPRKLGCDGDEDVRGGGCGEDDGGEPKSGGGHEGKGGGEEEEGGGGRRRGSDGELSWPSCGEGSVGIEGSSEGG